MPSKTLERQFVSRMLKDLGWSDTRAQDGDEPPDFFLVDSLSVRDAVEVTQMFRREGRKGSPDHARERNFEGRISALKKRYFKSRDHAPIEVSVLFPPVTLSPALRPWSPDVLKGVMERALASLLHLPRLTPLGEHRFEVRQRDGRPVVFRVRAHLENTGLEPRWTVVSNAVGTVGQVDTRRLQARVKKKAERLASYRSRVRSAFLLVVADGKRASGFLRLPTDTAVDLCGFDAVYFQANSWVETVKVRPLE